MILKLDAQELQKVVELASDGNWLPIGLLFGCLSLVATMFLIILRMKDKQNEIKHDKHDKNIDILTSNSIEMNKMISVHEAEINNLKDTA